MECKHGVDRVAIDQRAHQRFLVERVTDRHRLVGGQKFLAHLVGDRFMHDDAPGGSATLTSGPNRAEEDRLRRHLEIGARADDERIVAAQFHDAFDRGGRAPSSRPRSPSAPNRSRRRAECVDRRESFCPTVTRSPIRRVKIAGSAPVARQTRSAILITAMAVSGVFSEGFQTVASPQTAARAAFHDQTATGKLKAEITPTTPSGCHCSIRRWFGRSD